MELKIVDFNGSDNVLSGSYAEMWRQVQLALESMPLHLKSSDQSGKQGGLIFDPVGTNAYIKATLAPFGWSKASITPEYDFLGVDVDFARSGVVLEAQFSNYPFLVNNLLRSELFYREKVQFAKAPLSVVVIVTKAGMLPASNSTLYYEQALKQLNGFAKYKLFTVPARLIGLFSPIHEGVPATFTGYKDPRYSRTVVSTRTIVCNVIKGRAERCSVVEQ